MNKWSRTLPYTLVEVLVSFPFQTRSIIFPVKQNNGDWTVTTLRSTSHLQPSAALYQWLILLAFITFLTSLTESKGYGLLDWWGSSYHLNTRQWNLSTILEVLPYKASKTTRPSVHSTILRPKRGDLWFGQRSPESREIDPLVRATSALS